MHARVSTCVPAPALIGLSTAPPVLIRSPSNVALPPPAPRISVLPGVPPPGAYASTVPVPESALMAASASYGSRRMAPGPMSTFFAARDCAPFVKSLLSCSTVFVPESAMPPAKE